MESRQAGRQADRQHNYTENTLFYTPSKALSPQVFRMITYTTKTVEDFQQKGHESELWPEMEYVGRIVSGAGSRLGGTHN